MSRPRVHAETGNFLAEKLKAAKRSPAMLQRPRGKQGGMVGPALNFV